MLAVWAEMDVVLADEFRDGMYRADGSVDGGQAAFARALKRTSYYYRGDAACTEGGCCAGC